MPQTGAPDGECISGSSRREGSCGCLRLMVEKDPSGKLAKRPSSLSSLVPRPSSPRLPSFLPSGGSAASSRTNWLRSCLRRQGLVKMTGRGAAHIAPRNGDGVRRCVSLGRRRLQKPFSRLDSSDCLALPSLRCDKTCSHLSPFATKYLCTCCCTVVSVALGGRDKWLDGCPAGVSQHSDFKAGARSEKSTTLLEQHGRTCSILLFTLPSSSLLRPRWEKASTEPHSQSRSQSNRSMLPVLLLVQANAFPPSLHLW